MINVATRRGVNRSGVILLCVAFTLLTVLCVLPGLFTPYDPLLTNAEQAFLAPSIAHPLGTDQVGRDVWARIVYGAQSSVFVGVGATAVALLIGSLLGALGSAFPSRITFSMNRSVEVLMAVPELLIALLVVAIAGPGPISVFLALSIASIPAYLNVTRVKAITIRRGESVQSARVLGLHPTRIFARYILFEAVQPAIALSVIGVGLAIMTAAGLSFLGLGVQAPAPNWGLMLAEAQDYLARAWWLVVFPGVALTLTVGVFMMLGREVQKWMR